MLLKLVQKDMVFLLQLLLLLHDLLLPSALQTQQTDLRIALQVVTELTVALRDAEDVTRLLGRVEADFDDFLLEGSHVVVDLLGDRAVQRIHAHDADDHSLLNFLDVRDAVVNPSHLLYYLAVSLHWQHALSRITLYYRPFITIITTPLITCPRPPGLTARPVVTIFPWSAESVPPVGWSPARSSPHVGCFSLSQRVST